MERDTKNRIKKAFVLLLKPLIKLALRNGINYREFSELSKGCFIKVAFDEYGVNGRTTNNSRVAMITGINRKDIKRTKDTLLEGGIEAPRAPDRIARIISGWSHDDKYSENGQARPLTETEFGLLAEEYGGDIAVTTLLKELVRSEVIEKRNEHYELKKLFYIPRPSTGKEPTLDYIDPDAITHAGSIINDHLTTIYHNLYREERQEPQRFERRATNVCIDKAHIGEFKQFIDHTAQRYLEEVDQWLTQHESTQNKSDNVRLGMGTYWIQGKDCRQ